MKDWLGSVCFAEFASRNLDEIFPRAHGCSTVMVRLLTRCRHPRTAVIMIAHSLQ